VVNDSADVTSSGGVIPGLRAGDRKSSATNSRQAGIHESVDFPGLELEELFTAATGYLMHPRAFWGHFFAFLEPRNVDFDIDIDFDIVYAILLTCWTNYMMYYSFCSGHLYFGL